MAQYTAYAPYIIFFQDQVLFDFAVAVCSGKALIASPAFAQALFGTSVVIADSGTLQTSPKGMYSIGYSLTDPGDEVNNPLPSGIFLSKNVDSVLVPAQAGVPASVFPATGPDLLLKWVGIILKAPKITPLALTLIRGRRFIGGLELAPIGEGGGTNLVYGCRDAARTIDGLGFAIRGNNTPGINQWDRLVQEYTAPAPPVRSRERFYFRLRTVGSTSCGFWRCRNSASPAAGAAFKINGSGGIEIYRITAASVQSLLATITPNLLLNTWYKIDVECGYAVDVTTPGFLIVWVNGIMKFNQTFALGTDGLGNSGNHQSSNLGRWEAAADNLIEYDLDDWINADLPLSINLNPSGDPTFPYDLDFNYGSSIKKHYADSGAIVNWVGGVQSVNQSHNPDIQLNSVLTSSTALAEIEVLTDVINKLQAYGLVLGMEAGIIGIYSSVGGGTNGQLGSSIDGNPYVNVTIDQQAVASFNSILFNHPGLASGLPYIIAALLIKHIKSNDANLDTTRAMQSVIEYVGIQGAEDYSPTTFDLDDLNTNGLDIPRVGQLHNCYYPNSPWGVIGPPPNSPVFAVGGTYVGNGTSQNIILPAPCHFLWIRALAGGSAGVKWFGAGLGGHRGTLDRVVPNYVNRMWFSSLDGITRFTVAGTDAEVNTNAVTYQYIAFCDPGMIFNLCGAYNRPSILGSVNLPFQDSGFLPACGFVQNEVLGVASNTQGLSYKGPGHPGTTGNNLSGAALATFGSFSAGVFGAGSNSLFNNANQANYSLWRTTNDCASVMVQIFSYVGNGAGGNRTINLTPASGRFPLFVLVIPHNAVAIFRDPSHAGANSATVDNLTNIATGITGAPAIDQITVGVTLNVNAIVYDVFVIPGDVLGWNNGTFRPGMCVPPSGPWPIPPNAPPTGINVLGNGGLQFNGVVPLTLLKDISGIYTLTPGLRHDELYDRQTGIDSVDVAIPEPTAKTGYIGG